MTREDAVTKATEIVDAYIKNPPTNSRGYADGWKPPTLEERTDSIIKLAEFLWEPPTEEGKVLPFTGVTLVPPALPVAPEDPGV